MNEPVQLIPALTLLEDGGEFTLRVSEAKWAGELGRSIISLIGGLGIARKLLIITPTDTKVFKFSPAPAKAETQAGEQGDASTPRVEAPPLKASQRISQDTSAPPSPELVGEYEEELRAQAAAEREIAAQQREMAQDALPPTEDEETVVEMPRKRGRPSKAAAALRAASPCGRCDGGGAIEGGGTCPVCMGKGSIAKWGGRR